MKVSGLCLVLFLTGACSSHMFQSETRLTAEVKQFRKAEFRVVLDAQFSNPYDQREVALDMVLKSPSGQRIVLPCYFENEEGNKSVWKARFAPRESGTYTYHFECVTPQERTASRSGSFEASPSGDDGFLRINDLWTLTFDSGKPFRGIGENIGWEPRSFSDQKWTYDYLLPRLSENGANFFRSWMAPNNFPLEWKTVKHTKRYSDTEEYFNPEGVRRLDEVLQMLDSLGLYMMLAFDSHNTLIEGNQWEIHNYNVKNGGPANVPEEFFTLKESRDRYKNRLRYIVARWGYSPNIAAWEFFNEIDNAAFDESNNIRINHAAITDWHREMASYLKSIDPFGHIVTTSVSHREIEGLFALNELDLIQMHIYRRTDQIPAGVKRFTERYGKPFAWGEFAYEWDWNKDFKVIADEMDFDYKRGLWYGMFSPTPILPMSWWWEFFDERGLTPYFRGVREINDAMLRAGQGSFETVEVTSTGLESFAAKCGEAHFVYLLNSGKEEVTTDILIGAGGDRSYSVEIFSPEERAYRKHGNSVDDDSGVRVNRISLTPGKDVVLILHTR